MPVLLLLGRCEQAEVIPAPPDMSCVAGWCDMIDTRHRMEGLRCRQSSYLPPDCRPGAAVAAAQEKTAGFPTAAAAAGGAAAAVKTVRNLYFLVHIEGRKGALPAEKELKRVTIFPSLTLVNATTTELDVHIAPSSASSKSGRRQLSVAPAGSKTAEAALQELHALQQRPVLSATLRRRSTFLVYEVPPNRPLRFRMRFAMLEGAEWSSVVSDLLSTQVLHKPAAAEVQQTCSIAEVAVLQKSCCGAAAVLQHSPQFCWESWASYLKVPAGDEVRSMFLLPTHALLCNVHIAAELVGLEHVRVCAVSCRTRWLAGCCCHLVTMPLLNWRCCTTLRR